MEQARSVPTYEALPPLGWKNMVVAGGGEEGWVLSGRVDPARGGANVQL